MSGEIFSHRAKTYPAPTETPSGTRCTAFLIPDDENIRAAVLDCLAYLCRPEAWEPSNSVSQIDMQALMAEMLYSEGTGC
jgi:hypothetical protein